MVTEAGSERRRATAVCGSSATAARAGLEGTKPSGGDRFLRRRELVHEVATGKFAEGAVRGRRLGMMN